MSELGTPWSGRPSCSSATIYSRSPILGRRRHSPSPRLSNLPRSPCLHQSVDGPGKHTHPLSSYGYGRAQGSHGRTRDRLRRYVSMTLPRNTALVTRLAANVRAARRAKQARLQDVSEATGLSVGYLSELENGRRSASAETLVRLADLFETSVDKLLGRH